jgi:hypothetical protein
MHRSALGKYCQEQGQDIGKAIDKGLRSCLTFYLDLPAALEVLPLFISEGISVLYKYTCALILMHQDATIGKCKKKEKYRKRIIDTF